jgi:hypothetical protein
MNLTGRLHGNELDVQWWSNRTKCWSQWKVLLAWLYLVPILFLRCCLALLPWIDRQEYGCAYRSLLSLYHSQQFTISNLFQATMKPKPFLNAVVIQLYNLIVFFLHYTAEDLVIISCLYMLIPL